MESVATGIGNTLYDAWMFIVSPGNIRIVIGIVLTVLIVQFFLKGTYNVCSVLLSFVISLIVVHFVLNLIGYPFDVFDALRNVWMFVKGIFEGAVNG